MLDFRPSVHIAAFYSPVCGGYVLTVSATINPLVTVDGVAHRATDEDGDPIYNFDNEFFALPMNGQFQVSGIVGPDQADGSNRYLVSIYDPMSKIVIEVACVTDEDAYQVYQTATGLDGGDIGTTLSSGCEARVGRKDGTKVTIDWVLRPPSREKVHETIKGSVPADSVPSDDDDDYEPL